MLKQILGPVALALVGALIAVAGTSAHRYSPYVGVAVCVILVLAGAVFARAWHRFAGLSAYAIGWAGVAMALVYVPGPGQSFAYLDDTLGRTWLLGAAAAIVLVAVIPTTVLEGRRDV